MEVAYLEKAIEDINFWNKSGNKNIQKKIAQLIESVKETPYEGIGKPEALKHELSGKWSRRINQEHRLIYEIEKDKVFVYSLRGHCNK
ncbi:MAG: Txe/YoeB family addiction module toxin [Ginsengibacter sp.]|jgi:toxin YoeB